MSKKIGIVGYGLEGGFGIGTAYAAWVSTLGELVIIPPGQAPEVDLLILPGGPDMRPAYYNEAPGFYTGNTCRFRDHFYDKMLDVYIERNTPIFGICLGFQMLNVKFGGTLFQHYGFENSPSRTTLSEKIILNVPKKTEISVNSFHHQGFFPEMISPEFRVIATSKSFRNVEVMLHNTRPIGGVQYHPEEFNCAFAKSIIERLYEIANNNKSTQQ